MRRPAPPNASFLRRQEPRGAVRCREHPPRTGRQKTPPPSFRRKPESRGGSAKRGTLGHSALAHPQRVIPAKAGIQWGGAAGEFTQRESALRIVLRGLHNTRVASPAPFKGIRTTFKTLNFLCDLRKLQAS